MSLACVNLHIRSNIIPLCDITEYTAYLFKCIHYNTLSIVYNKYRLSKKLFFPECTYSITHARVESDEVNSAVANRVNVLSIWIIQSSYRICIRAHFIYFWSKSMTRVHPRAVLESWKWCW